VSRVWVEKERGARELPTPVAPTIHRPADPSTRAMGLAADQRTATPDTRFGPLDNLPSGPTTKPRRASAIATKKIATVSTSVAIVVLLVAWVAIEAAPNVQVFVGGVVAIIGVISVAAVFQRDERDGRNDETPVALAPGQALDPPTPAMELALEDRAATRGTRSGPIAIDNLLFRTSTPRRENGTDLLRILKVITATVVVILAFAALEIFGAYVGSPSEGGAVGPTVTPADYAAVHTGLTMAQVEAIMGSDNGFVFSEEPTTRRPRSQCIDFAFGSSSLPSFYRFCFVHGRLSSKASQSMGSIAG
jgi:hypothetical protein